MSAPTLKYGLNITKKAPKAPESPKRKRIAFDDDEEDAGPPPPTKKKLDLSTKLAAEKASKSAVSEDADIYDYDASWETTNALRLQKKAADRADAIERKPKYMTQLLASAEVRKKDQLRAKEKQLQAERDAEGEEFADKESFVTEAYKKQMEEVKKAEEEEARREEEEAKKGGGLNHFYRGLLDQKQKEHDLIEKAAKEGLKAVLPDEPELDREKLAMKEGVVINENNEVVDKRQLLSAGLNIQRKPKAAEAARAAEAKRPEREAFANKDRMRQGVRERQSRMLEQQLEQAARQQAEQEEAERQKVQEAAQSKKSSSDVQSARERYLARKKAAAEEK